MNLEPYKLYQESIFTKLKQAFEQENQIQLAAKWIAESLKNEGWIYTSGTGHSHMLAEEIFYRAGGFAKVIPILDPPLMLHESASLSTEIERKEGYGEDLIKNFPLSSKDIFIISSNSGRNAVPIEMANFAKSKGAKVIVITNLAHSHSVESRHSSGLKLYQLGDVVLDNFGEIGDASVSISGKKVGATSTVIGVALLQAILVQAAGLLIKEGIDAEIFHSSNGNEGEEINERLISKYKNQIKGL
ncbi:putative phosphosugar-binding protein [Algoriphagus boseongensis]|uniref:Putative phosphosugar-binding protein n=1 Tax=Algoriphagus boseongensis TaxID=1442587 RepID=A0A4R6T7M7_9BACT|nr:SIS domain-containing protein [Algoriphagus boseongensis]TDQ18681.1 putative phosphosugar-binding protein [Algoriphagus boseongensis]